MSKHISEFMKTVISKGKKVCAFCNLKYSSHLFKLKNFQ